MATNYDKMLQAVLLNEKLMKLGNYTAADIAPLYQAQYSDNFVIYTVAQIIKRYGEKATEKDLYKELTDYLKKQL